jgi:hypothetical protein
VSCFTSPNVEWGKVDDHVTSGGDLCIVFDADLPVSATGINEIKFLSVILIHSIFIVFILPPSNV